MAAWTIRKAGLSNLKISGQIPDYDNLFRIGIRKYLPQLRDILDRGVATLTPLEVQQVVNRHIAVQVASPIDLRLIGRIVLAFLVIAGIGLAWILQLTRMNRRIIQREEALGQSEQRYRQLVESSNDGILVSQDDYLRFVNPAMSRITGYSDTELLGFRVQELVHPEDRETVAENHRRRLEGRESVPAYAFRLRRSDQEWIWVEVGGVCIQWNGRPAALNFITDISRRKQDEEHIQSLVRQLEQERDQARLSALTDGLTGVPNRRHFDQAFEDEVQRFRRSGMPLSLIMIDIDQFKKYNDHYGHQAGDDCLRRVADALVQVVGRRPDMVARYGGEEFVALLPETPAAGAQAVAEKLRHAVEDLGIAHEASDYGPVVTISLGGAVWEGQAVGSPEELVAQADAALYRAKKAGRNRFVMAGGGTDGNRAEA
jgi:diguanylate cyclase (GGDEF)-like protein/PAS domain S-box-containing protein